MYPRTDYEMTEADLKKLLGACKSVPVIIVGGFTPPSPQENANRAWEVLGKKMGFDSTTVRPINGKGQRFFSAVPSETDEARKERVEKEEEKLRRLEIEGLQDKIYDYQKEVESLIAEEDAREEAANNGPFGVGA